VSATFDYLLRLGDNALVLGQRTAAWIAHAPIMEEDVALANVSLDLFGQARLWLDYAGEIEGAGRDADALAFHRDPIDFRNVLLVEQPNGNYADTIVRGWFFDTFSYLQLTALSRSSDPRVSEIASKAVKETLYHLQRSEDWLARLGDGPEVSRERAQRAVDGLWRYTGEAFIGDEIDAENAASGAGVDPATLADAWNERTDRALARATLTRPKDAYMQRGGKQGRHTEALGYMLAEMQVLPRAHPQAVW
jgi:ring-1,2-phenylacetyl-CoA epoxidase subunit PaaC